MHEAEMKLLALLKERSLQLGEFRLASGDESNYYIDGKMIAVFSRSAALIGEILYERTKDLSRMFHVSEGRISQLRAEFRKGWLRYCGETDGEAGVAVA